MIEQKDRIAFLKKIHLFYGLDEEDFPVIAEDLEELTVPKGGVVFEQESKSESFFMIYKGNVRITRQTPKEEIQLAVLTKNDYFGEMGLVYRRKRSGTVTATSDTILLALPRESFEDFFRNSPQLRLNMDVAVESRKLARTLQFQWLRADEVIYFLARKHKIVMYQMLLKPLAGLLLPIGIFYVYFAMWRSFMVLSVALLVILALILWAVWLVIDWGNDYYIVTNQRVVWLEKVVGMYDSRTESPIKTILSVGVETDQLGRVMDYGNVIIRTFVGKVEFKQVTHPEQAQHMIEEYWNRTKEHATGIEKEALKNAIRKRLGLPLVNAGPGFSDPASFASKPQPAPKPTSGALNILKYLGVNGLKLRYEDGENVIYRKHWVPLLIESYIPFLSALFTSIFFFGRLIWLAFDPVASFISFVDGFSIDTWTVLTFLSFFPFAAWFIYELVDWSNDKFEVTNDQIIDIDRSPFKTETRNSAPLDSILGTTYERKGLLGNIFNYGTVYITVGGNKMAFEDVVEPATVQSDIDRRRMLRQAKQSEGKLTQDREQMAEWLAFYHQSVEQFREEEKKFKGK